MAQEYDQKIVEGVVKRMRAFFEQDPMPSISDIQRNSLRTREVKGRYWLLPCTLMPPNVSVRDMLVQALEGLSIDKQTVWHFPVIQPVEVEWLAAQTARDSTSTESHISGGQEHSKVMESAQGKSVILYVHGGAFYRGDPSSVRSFALKLAQLTQGCCVSIRYRLAPQHPFPAALADLLVTYLSLIHSAPGSPLGEISASKIILVGDSSGANLCFALVQLILELHRHGTPNSRIPLPAGVATFSAWTDLTLCLPSMDRNANLDYFSRSSALDRVTSCEIWPSKPPRGTLYAEISKLNHPLASPMTARDWTGAPPMWICCGEEMLADDSRVLAQRAALQGCTVFFSEYEAMPHCFPFILKMPQTYHSLQACADFCRCCVETPGNIQTRALKIKTSMACENMDIHNLIRLTQDEIDDRIRLKMQNKAQQFERKYGSQPKL